MLVKWTDPIAQHHVPTFLELAMSGESSISPNGKLLQTFATALKDENNLLHKMQTASKFRRAG